ncbi:unnamed protein product, partial [Allacma fusca]
KLRAAGSVFCLLVDLKELF